MKDYNEMVTEIARSDKSVLDRGDIIIKEMSRVISDILDYRYIAEHHNGNVDIALNEKAGTIKNSLAILESDVDIYVEQLGMSKKIFKEKCKRVEKISNKINRSGN